jgi:quinol monooxygenase YgiN
MQDIVIFIAVLKAKEGQKQNLKKELLKLIGPTRSEPGCLDYVLFELKESPGTFYMREAYKDKAALNSHMASPHLTAFLALSEDLLAEPLKLIGLDQIST